MSGKGRRVCLIGQDNGPSTFGSQQEEQYENNPDGPTVNTDFPKTRTVGRPRKGSRLPSGGNPEPLREPASEANSQIGSTKDHSTPKVGEQYSFIQQPAINLTKVFAGKENEDLEQWLEGFQAQTYRSLLEGRAKNLIRKLPLSKTDNCEKVIEELRNVFGNLRSKDPREELNKLRKDPNESYQYFGKRVVELIQIVYEGINGLCANMLNVEYFISSLLRAKIIEPVPLKKVPRFCGTFFLVRRPSSKVRPIADFSSLTKCIEAPKFALKSLYQVATDTQWPRHLWYVKLDFKQAFFNVELHPKSKFVTTFGYGGKFYVFNRMPFGLSIAPYVKQMLLNAVLTFIRKYTRYTYGHLDDLLIAHRDQAKLQVLVDVLRAKLRQAGWVLNTKKSQLNPVKRLVFLGAEWDGLGIKRSPEASKFVKEMAFSLLTQDPKGRTLARSRQPDNLEKAIKYARQYEREQLFRAKSPRESKNKDKLLMATETPKQNISVPTNSFLDVADKLEKVASEIMSQLSKLNSKTMNCELRNGDTNEGSLSKTEVSKLSRMDRWRVKRQLQSPERSQNKRLAISKRCYLCSQIGHIQYNCPNQKGGKKLNDLMENQKLESGRNSCSDANVGSKINNNKLYIHSLYDSCLHKFPFSHKGNNSMEPLGDHKTNNIIGVHKTVSCRLDPNNLIEVSISIFGKNLSNCLDTGASRNFIRKSVLDAYEDSGYDINKVPLEKIVRIQIGDGTFIDFVEEVQLYVKIHQDPYLVTFLVMEELTYDCILGMEFILKYNVSVKPASKELQLDSDYDLYDPTRLERSRLYLFSEENIFLPPFCSVMVKTKSNRKYNGESLVVSNPYLAGRFGLFTAKGIVTQEEIINVNVSYLSATTICLPRGTILSHLSSKE
ncbi:PHD finger 21A [Brachionus plicatilis]|uniref:PHD finger 21A n=1 Tax=Brachionus plicatilis TaxID=10195 RepID=A0A3M7SAL6_BRAPC|nr:PHD finger 21A [Brachionus plicatilis]